MLLTLLIVGEPVFQPDVAVSREPLNVEVYTIAYESEGKIISILRIYNVLFLI